MRRFAIPDIDGHSLYMLKLSHLVFQCLLRDTEIFHSFSGFFQQRSFEGPQGPDFAYRKLQVFAKLQVAFGAFWRLGSSIVLVQCKFPSHRMRYLEASGFSEASDRSKAVAGSGRKSFSNEVFRRFPNSFLFSHVFFWLLTLKQQIAY